MNVRVEVWSCTAAMYEAYEGLWTFEKSRPSGCIACYVMDHDDASQRRVLGEQCRNAFEGGQVVVTKPEAA